MRSQSLFIVSRAILILTPLALACPAVAATPTEPDEATKVRVSKAYGRLPLQFEANQGQTAKEVNFLSRGSGYTLFLTAGEAVLALGKGQREDSAEKRSSAAESKTAEETESTVLRLTLVGASTSLQVTGLDELPGKVNYFVGSNPAKWRSNVPTYGKVQYREVYPGIDLVYYGNQRQLEYDFVVSPDTDPGIIRLAFEGTDEISIDNDGNLILHTNGAEVTVKAPIVYQGVEGGRQRIAGSYVLQGDNQVGFQVAAYDRARALVIDPVLVYSTYLGGSLGDSGFGIAVDSAGSAYVTGVTYSTDFPTVNPIQGAVAGTQDAFVTKLNSAGSALVYSTYLGGSDLDTGWGIAVDNAGSAYVTGLTSSSDFPTANPIQGAFAGTQDAFVTKLNSAGSALVYSTYLGGSDLDAGYGIAVDSAASAYVTGATNSTNFPTANPIQGANAGGLNDAFVTKLDSAGSALAYSTYLGGTSDDSGHHVAVDSTGNAYVTGYTSSSDFPTVNPMQGAYAGAYDAFVTKLNSAGSALAYSTYLGGTRWDEGNGIAVDNAGSAYVTGDTNSTNFPTANPIQGAHAGGPDEAFVTKLNSAGSALAYSTYLGGTSWDVGNGIAVDSSGNAYVTGWTDSTNFPTVNPIQGANAGTQDAFVTKLDSAGAALAYSTYLGGTSDDRGGGVAVDSADNAYVTGSTSSIDFPTVNPIQGANAGSYDAFVTKIPALCAVDLDCDDASSCTTEMCDPQDPGADVNGCVYTAVNCDDGNFCTDDSCDPITGCMNTNNTTPCDDGDTCTIDDSCSGGVCLGTPQAGPCVDHFLCYKTKARQDIPDVTLSDQFDTDAVHQVKTAKLFCTPANVDGEGYWDQDTHLMGYKIRGPHARQTNVEVVNQFGSLFFDTRKADTLMVPTAKSMPPDPFPGLPGPGSLVDHYRCLKVKVTKGTDRFPKALKKVPVAVADQLGTRNVYLKKPSKLCLPVDKDGEGIKNPEAHLLCYKVKVDPRISPIGVQVTNQFGQAPLGLKKEAELCVLSSKNPTTTTTTTSTTTTTLP